MMNKIKKKRSKEETNSKNEGLEIIGTGKEWGCWDSNVACACMYHVAV